MLAFILLGYRLLITLPLTEQGLADFQERELSTLKLALDTEINFLKVINYDYSVWSDTYDFIQEYNQEFIDSNFNDGVFISLKIDGVFLYDLKLKTVFSKGFDFSEKKSIDLPIFNLLRTPEKQKLSPVMEKSAEPFPYSGFLSTEHGVVLFSATQVMHPKKIMKPVGVLVFVRKIRPSLIESLSKMSQLKLSFKEIKNESEAKGIKTLKGSLQGEGFSNKRQRVIKDIHGNSLILIDIKHDHSELPKLFDLLTILTLLLLTSIPLMILVMVNIYLVEPISKFTKVLNKMMETKQLNPIVQYSKVKEVRDLIKDFNHLILTIKEQQINLEALTLLDGLTSIANRRAFDLFLDSAWSSMQRNKLPVAVLMCDIDFFKPYNDNLGHQAGDDALRRVAQALDQRISRSSDLVSRYGGEEFAVVLKETSIESMSQVMEIILDTVKDLQIRHPYSKVSNIVTISVGAAIFTDFSEIPTKKDKNDLLAAADKALYSAKNNGRNRSESKVIDQ